MLQSILLPIEFILLAAVAYMYWQTRQLSAEVRIRNSSASVAKESEGHADTTLQAWQVEVIHEVANLLTEWQAAANTAREDGLRQQTELQLILKQAETTIAELRTLLAQGMGPSSLDAKLPECTVKSATSSSCLQPAASEEPQAGVTSRLNSDTWTEAIESFGEQLQVGGYSQSTISRTLGHIRQFAAWLSGPLYAQLPVRRLELLELASYRCYLETQLTQPHLIERELIAIKTFANWVNPVLGKNLQTLISSGGIQNSGLADTSPKSNHVSQAQAVDRYQTVFSLADQGFDPAAITAETGLEREAIRLLLTMGPRTTKQVN
ncbi:MAG: hypothetical protein HC875_00200 [Anaerolineales bacterium]|nr:hypothetical protein [Anaerolineales bacterium]